MDLFREIDQSQGAEFHTVNSDDAETNSINGEGQNVSEENTSYHASEEEKLSEYLEEEDIENLLENEKVSASQENTNQVESQFIPQEGMEFEIPEKAHRFFNDYAYLAGFASIIAHHARTQSRKINNKVIRTTYACNRQGKQDQKKEGNTQEEEVATKRDTSVLVKINCKCLMEIAETKGVWKVTRLNLEHNHQLSQTARYFRVHKDMTETEKKMIRTLHDCNIETKKMMYLLSYLHGGLDATPFRDKDISNFRGKVKRETSQNDMTQALLYFTKKREEDPEFFFRFDMDNTGKVKCIFWTDTKSIRYYEHYGDCMSFDTTYLTNKYNTLFAPFVGITGHRLTCIFGCALISDETTETFKWLFRTFLEAMGSKAPRSIMTDQDGAMRSSIKQILPQAINRNCVFHIKNKAELKCGRCFDTKKNLREELKDIIDNSLTEQEFELLWQQVVLKHGIEHIKYFQDIYKTRQRWAPFWFKQELYPFINTTSRSEGTNARFKRNVGPQYSVTNFFREYERIQETIFDNEAQAFLESNTKKVAKMMTAFSIEAQAHEAYNMKIFRKFQWQIKHATKFHADEIEKNKKYNVYTRSDHPIQEFRKRTYIVLVDQENENFSCICAKFQKDGMLCSHILKVMIKNDISRIPDKYIIDRWRKRENKIFCGKTKSLPTENPVLRFNTLSILAADINSEGAKSAIKYNYLVSEFERLKEEMKMMDTEITGALRNYRSSHGKPSNTKQPV